ncbi:MAG: hypothetical protein AAF591_09440 [Verrucomicrobiota bacterium]
MAVKLIANYAKRLGLPGFSSHHFSISTEIELTDLGQVQGEATRLYSLLQDAVDREIQHVGFVPGDTYGMNGGNGADHRNGEPRWACSDKQKELVLKLVDENGLDRKAVEQTAQDRFGTGVKLLNKLQMSGLIGELLEVCGNGKPNGTRNNGRAHKPAAKGGTR